MVFSEITDVPGTEGHQVSRTQDFSSAHWSGPPHLSPKLQLTGGPLPLPRWDTRRRLHKSSASLYTLYTFRSGSLVGGGGGVKGPEKHRCENHECIMNSVSARDSLLMLFNPSSFSFHKTQFEPQTYIRQPKQGTRQTVS